MNLAPLARIVLRYLIGAGILGSQTMGDQLAADPDLILYVSLFLAAVVEFGYGLAKKKGWAT